MMDDFSRGREYLDFYDMLGGDGEGRRAAYEQPLQRVLREILVREAALPREPPRGLDDAPSRPPVGRVPPSEPSPPSYLPSSPSWPPNPFPDRPDRLIFPPA